ncbi:MAG: nitrite/sulfite reductase [Myxococcaceae bacterium]
MQELRGRESFGDASEAAEFVAMLERFEKGELSAEQYRQYRLSRGIYGQRQEGLHMVRVKIPQGALTASQLRALADCADKYSRGYGHVTTRQNLQFHHVKPEHAGPFMEALAEAGLTTREACSHTVRNVVACPYAGVCAGAPFDVTPYAEAVTRHFLRAQWGSGLPRKFKITASGCEDDCAKAAMNDIGIVARVADGRRGFKLLLGGGTATLPRSAKPVFEWIPEEQLLAGCEAIVRVFHREGERKNLHKARLKWVLERLGFEKVQQLVHAELKVILDEGGRPLPELDASEVAPPRRIWPEAQDKRPLPAAFDDFSRTNVRAQVQPGYSAVTVRLVLGDVGSAQLRELATLVETYGDGSARTTLQQNLLLRWVANEALGPLWRRLEALGLGGAGADRISDVTSCPGAETCKIAVTASRGMAQKLTEHLKAKAADDGAAANADIKISGCPNGCGQHHVSAIGLQGGVRKIGEKLVPQYHLLLGGGVDARGATFGRLVARIPARRIPEAVDRLLAHFEKHRTPGEDPRAFFTRVKLEDAKALVGDLAVLDDATATPDDFVDLGSTVPFEVVAGDGECAA